MNKMNLMPVHRNYLEIDKIVNSENAFYYQIIILGLFNGDFNIVFTPQRFLFPPYIKRQNDY